MIHYSCKPGPSAARNGWEIQRRDVDPSVDASTRGRTIRALEYLERKAMERRPAPLSRAVLFAIGGFVGSLSVLLIK